MKTRGRLGFIAAFAITVLACAGCWPNAASPTASARAEPSSTYALAVASALPIASRSTGDAAASSLDGVYRWTLTKADALAHGLPEDKTPEALAQLPSISNRRLKDGTWTGDPDPAGNGGTYTVDGNRISFHWGSGVLTFTFVRDPNGDLHLTPVLPMDPGDQWVWAVEVWTKIG